jgi:hypothetical protein
MKIFILVWLFGSVTWYLVRRTINFWFEYNKPKGFKLIILSLIFPVDMLACYLDKRHAVITGELIDIENAKNRPAATGYYYDKAGDIIFSIDLFNHNHTPKIISLSGRSTRIFKEGMVEYFVIESKVMGDDFILRHGKDSPKFMQCDFYNKYITFSDTIDFELNLRFEINEL